MEKKAEKRKRSKEENAAAAEKTARKDVERFLADGDEDLELEGSGAEDEFVPEVELFPETDPEPAALAKLDCLKSQRKEVMDLVMPTVRRSALYAHSEAILQTLLCSEDQKERIEGVERHSAGGLLCQDQKDT
ncbi:hypothetical protein AAFF_G00322980 [Aldrovandia affinis]|uniref:Uncharacterized protein n=1 Tax=Aldrovandia affinis TaxID=143900 RepID=A0AAD7SNL1_9TELE|nr:hypothetical protein AAFF_G00322980 [Aldrovandia affinis]